MRKIVMEIKKDLDKANRSISEESIDSQITKIKKYILRTNFSLYSFKQDEQNQLIKLIFFMKYVTNKPMITTFPYRNEDSIENQQKRFIQKIMNGVDRVPARYDYRNISKQVITMRNKLFSYNEIKATIITTGNEVKNINKHMFYTLDKITVNSDITNFKNFILKRKIDFDNDPDIKYIKGYFNIFTHILKNIARTEVNDKIRERIRIQLEGIIVEVQRMTTRQYMHIQSYVAYYFEKIRNDIITELFTYRILTDSDEENKKVLAEVKKFIKSIRIEREENNLSIRNEYFYHLLLLEKRNEYKSLLEIRKEQVKKRNSLSVVPEEFFITNPDTSQLENSQIKRMILEKGSYDKLYKKHLEESKVLLNFFHDLEEIKNLSMYQDLASGTFGYNSGNLIHVKAVLKTVFRSKLFYMDGSEKKEARTIARRIIDQLKQEASINEYNKQDILFLKEIITRGIMREENISHRYKYKCEFKNLLDQRVLKHSMKLGLTNFHLMTQFFHFRILEYFFDILEDTSDKNQATNNI